MNHVPQFFPTIALRDGGWGRYHWNFLPPPGADRPFAALHEQDAIELGTGDLLDARLMVMHRVSSGVEAGARATSPLATLDGQFVRPI